METINLQAFDELKRALGLESNGQLLKHFQALEIASVSVQTYLRWKRTGNVNLDILIKLCNRTHFPLAYFLKPASGEEPWIYKIIPEGEWQDIQFCPDKFYKILKRVTDYKSRFKMKGFQHHLKELNAGDYTSLGKICLTDLLQICNELHISLYAFLKDPNVPLPVESEAVYGLDDDYLKIIAEQSRMIHDLQRKLQEMYQPQEEQIIRELQEELEKRNQMIDKSEKFASKQQIYTQKHLKEISELKRKNKELEHKLRNRKNYEESKQKK